MPAAALRTSTTRGAGLNLDKVVAGAVKLARSEGLKAVSMRRLGGQLGVEAMSLYHWVPTKAVLLGLMADRSAGIVLATAVGRGDWSAQLVRLILAAFRAGAENPAFLPALAATPLPTGPREAGSAASPRSQLLDRILDLLRQGRLTPTDLEHTARGLVGLLLGFDVLYVHRRRPRTQPAGADHHDHARAPVTADEFAKSLRFSMELFLTTLRPSKVGR